MSSNNNNNQYYEGEIPGHARAFTSMNPERDAVKEAAKEAASARVQRPAAGRVEDRSGSFGRGTLGRETDAATNQQFDANGNVRR
ncbi:hypothetical protein LTS15_007339 [Exophiala xenobiotica]|nr:hypothetical protein LTS15_007339 [Exophiala xenobiotica]